MWKEHHNSSSIERILKNNWNETFTYYYNTKQELGTLEDLENEFILSNSTIEVLKNFLNLSDDMINTIVHHWWYSEGSQQLKELIQEIIKNTGVILRCDHTYGVVKSLGIEENDKWVRLSI